MDELLKIAASDKRFLFWIFDAFTNYNIWPTFFVEYADPIVYE
jgi:hypothetical protein